MKIKFIKRPILFILIFYIIGIISKYNDETFIGLVSIALIMYIIRVYFRAPYFFYVIFTVFFLLGSYRTGQSISIKEPYIEEIVERKNRANIDGRIKQIGTTSNKNLKVTVESSLVNGNKINSKIIIYVKSNLYDIHIGDIIRIRGKIDNLEKQRNFGGYDEFLYLRSDKIQYKVYADEIKVIKKNNNKINVLKSYFQENIDNIFYFGNGDIVKAMILGDDSYLKNTTKVLYRDAGIYHILIISGLHIGIIFQLFNYIFTKIQSLSKYNFLIIILLILYSQLTGNSISTIRAIIMISTYISAKYFLKKRDSITSLILASMIILIYEPLNVFHIGFLYSFSAVIGIFLFSKIICEYLMEENLFYKKNNFFRSENIANSLSIIFSVILTTTPVSLYFFYYFNPYNAITNVLIMPVTFILVLFSFIVTTLGGIIPILKYILMPTIFNIIKYIEFVSSFIVSLPFSKILIGRPNIIFICLFYFFITYHFYFKIKTKKKEFVIYGFIIIAVLFVNNYTEITFLDVGQGDSIVIEHKNKVVIIDGGINKRELENYLNFKGITKIDMIIGTHTDKDHIGGLIEIIGKKKIDNFILPLVDFKDTDNNYNDLILALNETNINLLYVRANDKLNFGDLDITVLNPFKTTYNNKNDSSVVLKVVYKDISFLFTGDIEKEEFELIKKFNLTSDILKLSHHGSKTSNSLEFIKAVSPKIAVVSSKKNNSYGHPNEEVIKILEDENIKMLNTAKLGDIKFKTDGKSVYLKTIR